MANIEDGITITHKSIEPDSDCCGWLVGDCLNPKCNECGKEYVWMAEQVIPDCDKQIYTNGKPFMIMASAPVEVFEILAKHIAKETGDKIDWHFVGGRARFLTLGDVDKAQRYKPQIILS